ncbi:uncharacterized protein LOC125042682 [Penaeus chinensis]|uniref:uncharacterized protein LOC125042682 n=1 Tax=Penaeus chinensis TaxID=139456 RepID=UPI001FB7416F|nr:uncharacterized protein LOC125042682 [Penaeus chinensis]XP_047494459.1 uncharacterized protein LOC125042682 [Penaeus chinensis]
MIRSSHPLFRKIPKILGKGFLKQKASSDIGPADCTQIAPRIVEVQSTHEERRELYNRHDWRRSKYQSDYVIVHAMADEHHARLIRAKLESSVKDVVVLGSWSISLGEQILEAWERMLRNTTTVLVLMSRALCSERLPVLTSMTAVQELVTVVPIFLEDIPRGGLPDGINMLRYRQGVDLYRLGHDASVAELARHTSVTKRYARECASLRKLQKIRRQSLNWQIMLVCDLKKDTQIKHNSI